MVDFNIRVIVDPSGARRGGRQVRRELDGVNQAVDRTRRLIQGAFAFAGVGLGLGGTIRILADFEQALSTVRGITGATEEQFAALREEAAELGATTRFSATDAANGLLFLSRAGFEVNESLEAIGGTLTLAQAGSLGLGRAADIASNVLQGFRLRTDQTNRVVDVLALTANSANTNVAQLGEALAFVAPVAAGLGVQIEETSAAVGVLSNAGLQASVAGTGLRRVLAELESPSTRTRDILADLGVSADEVRVSQVGLTAAIERLGAAGLDTGRALEVFGQRGGPAFEVISSSLPDLERLTEELGNAEGTAANLARIMDDNLNGALLSVRSAVEAVVLAIGEAGATGALQGALSRLASLLRLVAANGDALVAALEVVGTVLLVQLARVAVPALIGAVASLSASLLALSVRALPLLAAAGGAAFAALAITAAANGQSLEETFNQVREALTGLADGFLEPIEVVNAFEDRIGVFVREIGEIGGIAALTRDQTESLVARMQALREEINRRLLFQEFLAPGSEAVVQLRDQVDVLDRALVTLRRNLERVDPDLDVVDPPDVTPPPMALPGTRERAEVLAREIDLLEQEAQILRAVGDERDILRARLELEEQLRNTLREANADLTEEQLTNLSRLTAAEAEQVESLLRTNQALQDQADALDEIRAPVENYERGIAALQALLDQGRISTEEFADAQRDLRLELLDTATDIESGFERGFLRLQEQFTDLASIAEDTLVGAFREAEDALVDFVVTGQGSFTDLVNSIQEDLARLAIRSAITGPLAGLVGGGGAGGGGAGFLGSLFGTGAGGGGFNLGSLLGFQTGGSITIGGRPGIDRNLLSINGAPVARVSRGETVNVTPQGGGGMRPLTVNFNFAPGTDAESFRRSEGQIAARTAQVLRNADRRNN